MKTKLDIPLVLMVFFLGLFGAGILFVIGQLTWMMVWLGLWLIAWLVVLVKQFGGSDAAASALFVFAGFGSLVSAGLHVYLAPLTIAFDPFGFILAASLLVVAVLVLAWRTAKLVMVTRGGDQRQSFFYLLEWMFGQATSYQEVVEGEVKNLTGKPPDPPQHELIATTRTPTMKRPGGHLALTIHPGNAVVYERNGEYAGVLGPGTHYLSINESIRKVIVTFQRGRSGTLKEIMTQDAIPVTIEYSVSYRVKSGMEPEMGRPYPYSEEACKQAAYNAPNWESKIVNGAGGLIADKVAGMRLEELFDLRNPATYPLGDMMNKLTARLQASAERYGANVIGVDIDKIDLPPTVRERMLAQWQADQEVQRRVKYSKDVFGLVADKDGKFDPAVALQLLDKVMGADIEENISASEMAELMRAQGMREIALVDALARQRTRTAASGVPSIIATPRST